MIDEKEPPANSLHAHTTFKSNGGLGRLAAATRYSFRGIQAAYRHEAAFRQELAVGIPLLLAIPWLAADRWEGLAMAASIVLVFIVELLNSALEAIADALTLEHHPLLGRAKDLGSAAVLASLIIAVATWAIALWP
jgi:diacylglycerol kinase (ATP)